jgi:hypothetical protein
MTESLSLTTYDPNIVDLIKSKYNETSLPLLGMEAVFGLGVHAYEQWLFNGVELYNECTTPDTACYKFLALWKHLHDYHAGGDLQMSVRLQSSFFKEAHLLFDKSVN